MRLLTCAIAQSLTQLLDGTLLLYASDFSVFFGLAFYLNSLPGQFPSHEIEQQETQGFQVVLPALFVTHMRGNAGIARGAHQRFALLERNMRPSFGITIAFSQSKIDDVDNILLVALADHKVVGLDVSVDEALAMDGLQPVNNLDADLVDRADAKLAVVGLEQILEGAVQQVDHHEDLLALVAVVVQLGDAG